jgi:hypothetical protein
MFFEPGSMLSEGYCALRYKISKSREGSPRAIKLFGLLRMKGLRKADKILRHHPDDAAAWAVNVRDEKE